MKPIDWRPSFQDLMSTPLDSFCPHCCYSWRKELHKGRLQAYWYCKKDKRRFGNEPCTCSDWERCILQGDKQ